MSDHEKKSVNAEVDAMLDMKADNDELMKRLRDLLRQRDELEERLTANNHECDFLSEVFSCTTKEDIQRLVEEFFPDRQSIPPIPTEERDALVERVSLLNNYEAQKHLGIGIRRLNPETIMVEFVPPANYSAPDLSLIKLEEKECTYKLIHSLFPSSVPVAELEKKYLENENKQDVPAFLHSVHQYLWCFWKRDIEVQNIKKADYMKDSVIYHNKDRTVVSFTVNFLMKYIVEIRLLIDPLSYIAHSVDYLVQDEKAIPQVLADALEELKHALQLHPLSAVLHTNFTNDDEAVSKQLESNSNETESNSTVVSEIFK